MEFGLGTFVSELRRNPKRKGFGRELRRNPVRKGFGRLKCLALQSEIAIFILALSLPRV